MTTITHANSPYKVSGGVTDTDDIVSSGGSMYVLSGGTAFGTTVESSGLLTVSKGGTDLGTILAGKETLSGLSISTTIESGGKATVYSDGNEIAPTISAGGVLDLLAGGTVTLDAFNSGTLETTASGGLITPNSSTNTIDNAGKVGALGTNANLMLSAVVVSNTAAGVIFASGTGARVELDESIIVGGTLATSGPSAMIEIAPGTVDVYGIAIAKGALLEVEDEATLNASGTVANSGTIWLSNSNLTPAPDLTLTGGGFVKLVSGGEFFSDNDPVSITNVNNTIVGDGYIGIGDTFGAVTLVNSGTIDANVAHGLLLIANGSGGTNAGMLEATNSATLCLAETIISNTGTGTVQAVGSSAKVVLYEAVISGGIVKATGGGTITAEFLNVLPGNNVAPSESNSIDSATIAGGSPVVVTSGGTLFLDSDTIGTSASIKVSDGGELDLIGGTISAHALIETLAGGSAFIGGTVTNSGTIFAAASGSYIDGLFATINGGFTEVGNGTAAVGGGEAVTFESNGTGALELVDDAFNPTEYSGQVSHFGQNIHQAIDLTNVAFVSGAESATFSGTTTSGLLTVTSGGTTVAKINLIGDYQHVIFTPHGYNGTVGNAGSLEIADPPADDGGHHHHEDAGHSANLGLLGNYVAGFPQGGYGGLLVASVGETEAPPLLVHPHTG